METKTSPSLKTVKKTVKHVFVPDEIAALNLDFRNAFSSLKTVEADLEKVKAQYKAKTKESESRLESLNSLLQAGFELRDEPCVEVLDFKNGEKRYFIERTLPEQLTEHNVDPLDWPAELAVIVEPMTDNDRQQALIESEAKFEECEDIKLFEGAGDDYGTLKVGRLQGKWFTALRVRIGARKLEEWLNEEDPASRKRPDAVKRALKEFTDWLNTNLGREEAKGFKNAVELVKAGHAERVGARKNPPNLTYV